MRAAMLRRSPLCLWLWLWLCLAAQLTWIRCSSGEGEQQQQQHPAGPANGTGDRWGSDSAPLSRCVYTFILPEVTGARQPRCTTPSQGVPDLGTSDSIQGAAAAAQETQSPVGQRIQHLELAMHNYTHWIQQVSQASLSGAGLSLCAGPLRFSDFF